MTLTIDGQLQQVHPVIRTMIELLAEKQDGIWRRGYGCVELHFSPCEVALKVYDTPVFTGVRKTKNKPAP